jgi:hypothetical protein
MTSQTGIIRSFNPVEKIGLITQTCLSIIK